MVLIHILIIILALISILAKNKWPLIAATIMFLFIAPIANTVIVLLVLVIQAIGLVVFEKLSFITKIIIFVLIYIIVFLLFYKYGFKYINVANVLHPLDIIVLLLIIISWLKLLFNKKKTEIKLLNQNSNHKL